MSAQRSRMLAQVVAHVSAGLGKALAMRQQPPLPGLVVAHRRTVPVKGARPCRAILTYLLTYHRSSRGSLQFYTRSELARETEPLGTSARSQCLAAPPASLGKAATFHFVADLDGLCCACRPSRLRRSRCSACSPAPLCETTAAHAWSAAALRGAKWHCTLPASGARCAGAWPQNRTPHTVW